MRRNEITSMQRVLTAISHKEPDRVPFFLLLTMHGAKEMGLSIKEYFSKAEHVAEGQLRMRRKYGHDCLYSLFYAPVEIEAWGGEVIYYEDGPPNSGTPFIKSAAQINGLTPPAIKETPCLIKVLKAIHLLAEKAAGKVPVIGVAISPFSIPVMQMGFEAYLELIYREPERFRRLMAINEAFCIDWANAQLAAGATAICYFDPVSSPTIIPRDLYLKTGHLTAKRTIARINGPTVTHLASGHALPIAGDLGETGTAGIAVSARENLEEIKAICRGRLTVIGNLNGLEMPFWTLEEAFFAVQDAMFEAGPGGGFILSDNHGEIPWQVSDDILLAISETVYSHGRYPIQRPEH